MATKYYVPAAACLTLTEHSGNLSVTDMLENLMRMLTMDRTEGHDQLTAEEAEEAISQLNRVQFRQLKDRAREELYSQEMQEYLQRKGITEGMQLDEVNADEVDVQDILDEFTMTEFKTMEMSVVEWD